MSKFLTAFSISAMLIFASFTAFAVGSGPYVPKYPRPAGLIGCGCYWEVRFDLKQASALKAYEIMERIRPKNYRIKLSSTGVDVIRSERDLCERDREDAWVRDSYEKNDTILLQDLAEIAKAPGFSLLCGDSYSMARDKQNCNCPVPGVMIGN